MYRKTSPALSHDSIGQVLFRRWAPSIEQLTERLGCSYEKIIPELTPSLRDELLVVVREWAGRYERYSAEVKLARKTLRCPVFGATTRCIASWEAHLLLVNLGNLTSGDAEYWVAKFANAAWGDEVGDVVEVTDGSAVRGSRTIAARVRALEGDETDWAVSDPQPIGGGR